MTRNNSNPRKNKSELTVLTKVSELATYIAAATISAPAKYRQSYVLRLQNLSLDAMQLLYEANSYALSPAEPAEGESRLGCQRKAYVTLKTLSKFLFAAFEVKCLIARQYQHAAKLLTETMSLLAKWERSDFKRLGKPPLPFMLDEEIDEPIAANTAPPMQNQQMQIQKSMPQMVQQYSQTGSYNYVPQENYGSGYGQYVPPVPEQYNQGDGEVYYNGNSQYND